MALVNSFDQWQKISVPSNSYLSLKQLNDGQCQWELIEKTHAKPAIKDWQNLPANEFNHLQTKRLYQSLTSLIEDSKTRRWFVGEHPWWDWSFNLQFIEDLTPDDPLNRWIEEMADKLDGWSCGREVHDDRDREGERGQHRQGELDEDPGAEGLQRDPCVVQALPPVLQPQRLGDVEAGEEPDREPEEGDDEEADDRRGDRDVDRPHRHLGGVEPAPGEDVAGGHPGRSEHEHDAEGDPGRPAADHDRPHEGRDDDRDGAGQDRHDDAGEADGVGEAGEDRDDDLDGQGIDHEVLRGAGADGASSILSARSGHGRSPTIGRETTGGRGWHEG